MRIRSSLAANITRARHSENLVESLQKTRLNRDTGEEKKPSPDKVIFERSTWETRPGKSDHGPRYLDFLWLKRAPIDYSIGRVVVPLARVEGGLR